jgi:hypothetical protein
MQKLQKKTLTGLLEKMKTALCHELYLLLCHYTNEHENTKIDKETLRNVTLRIQAIDYKAKTTNESYQSQLSPEEKKIIYNQLEDGPLKRKFAAENPEIFLPKIDEETVPKSSLPVSVVTKTPEKKTVSSSKRKIVAVTSTTNAPESKKLKHIHVPVASTSAQTTIPIMEEECIMVVEEPPKETNLPSPAPPVTGTPELNGQTLGKKSAFEFFMNPDSLLTQMRNFHTFETEINFFNLISQQTLNLNVGSLRKFLKQHFLSQVEESEFVELVIQKYIDFTISRELHVVIIDLVYEERNGKDQRKAVKELFQNWKQGKMEDPKELNDLMSTKVGEIVNKKLLEIQESIKNGEIKKNLDLVGRYIKLISGDAANVFDLFLELEKNKN